MSDFVKMRDALIDHFNKMTKDATHLFEVDVNKDELWNLYLDSFPKGTNEIYRKRREHDCSCCRHFIKTIGNAVVIKNNEIETIWDFNYGDTTYQPVLNALSVFIKSHVVTDIFVIKEKRIGVSKNFETLPSSEVKTWEHFYLELPNKFVNKTYRTVGDLKGDFRDTKNVFKRSLEEITEDSILTVLELINSNSLHRGTEWKALLKELLKYKKDYDKLEDSKKDNYVWEQSVKVGSVIGRIRNYSIGTLLVNISEGMELNTAVSKYDYIVCGANYKRSKPIFTKKMLDDAIKTITDMGYMDSLQRRYATLNDISVNDILFCNRDSAKRINDSGIDDLFESMKKEVTSKPKKFSKVEEVNIDKFIADILPTANELEVYLENKHASNMVSLIAPVNKDSKTMFKWNNNFSWAYSGNMADSMKEKVKAVGGNVDGVLRFSILWNDVDGYWDESDLDAHCIEPTSEEIFYSHKVSRTGGNLDVDITHPSRGMAAVENITWSDKRKMKPGIYRFFVYQFANRRSKYGFRAEIEFDGQIRSFNYNKGLRQNEDVQVAEVILDENGNFSIKELLPATTSSKEIWGVKSNQFIPVSVVCYSPNYWEEGNGSGNKHVFFMLKDCKNTEEPNGFYNEYLNQELYNHRKVMEALGAKAKVEDCEDQLSGVGFSTTKRDEVIVKVKGSTERIMKVKF